MIMRSSSRAGRLCRGTGQVKDILPDREDHKLRSASRAQIFPIGQIHRFMGQSWADPRSGRSQIR
jgi:hypothetical protein